MKERYFNRTEGPQIHNMRSKKENLFDLVKENEFINNELNWQQA